MSRSCPLCRESARAVFQSRVEVAADLCARDRFFAARLRGRVSRRVSRDLTNVALGTPAAILRCTRCGVLIRDGVPDDEVFRDDRYDGRELESLRRTHVRAFAGKEPDYRPLLPPRAKVVEVGSYVGGFLSTAAKWGWRAAGADIGRDAARFCRECGLDVQCLSLEECGLKARSLDAVFIWNCFEQLADPGALLAEVRRVLCAGGMLVVRVPDAGFYVRRRRQKALALLAYNGLLGWPHRFGYGERNGARLVRQHGFTVVRALRRPVVRPLREAMCSWAREEEARLVEDAGHGWLELTCILTPSCRCRRASASASPRISSMN